MMVDIAAAVEIELEGSFSIYVTRYKRFGREA
jgi:hypothetical protein